MSTPTVLAVDGNSLLHRAFHASARTMYRTPDGAQGWAVRGLLSQLVAAVDRVCADAVVVGFDDRGNSSRKKRWPSYKAQRAPKPESLERQLDLAVQVLRELGVVVVVPEGLEADDVLASVAAQAPTLGAQTVVATSDRDSFSLIDEHTRMLRILNGGVDASPLLDPERLAMVTGVRPDQYLDLAALRGDTSDNLPGRPRLRHQDRGPAAAGARHRARPPSTTRPPAASSAAPRSARPGPGRSSRPRPRSGGCSTARSWRWSRRRSRARARGGPGRAAARRGRRARDVLPLRAARPHRDPRRSRCASPTRTVAEPYVDPRWTAAPRPKLGPLPSWCRRRGPGLRAGDPF